VDVLRQRGVLDEHILCFVDHRRQAVHLQPYGIDNVYHVSQLVDVMSHVKPHSYVVVTVTGHGQVMGLGGEAWPLVRPAELVAAIRSVPGITLGVVMLTQCFGGIFHLLDAASIPPLVLLGATNLNPSLSISIQLRQPLLQTNGAGGLSGWAANVFMADFFEWLRSPMDIDGDGNATLLDAYRAAGVRSNERLRKIKAGYFMQARTLASALEQASRESKPEIVRQAIEKQLQDTLEILHTHQEPWILHANLARQLQF
jgi:hypothetical protein